MWHGKRKWGVAMCEAQVLARDLHERTWTLCTAFETPGGTVWANDSTSEDGVQEFAVLRRLADFGGSWIQVESITVSWCSEETLMAIILDADRGEYDEMDRLDIVGDERIERVHAPCEHCR